MQNINLFLASALDLTPTPINKVLGFQIECLLECLRLPENHILFQYWISCGIILANVLQVAIWL